MLLTAFRTILPCMHAFTQQIKLIGLSPASRQRNSWTLAMVVARNKSAYRRNHNDQSLMNEYIHIHLTYIHTQILVNGRISGECEKQ